MIVGIGIDIVEVERFEKKKDNLGFLRIAFTAAELEYCKDKPRAAEHYAARFAAKEAFFKALGSGLVENLEFSQVEVVNDSNGKPELKLYGAASLKAAGLGASKCHLSISHEKNHAVAFVILES